MSFGQGGPMGMMRGMAKDQSVLRARLEQGTTRRVLGYARPFVRFHLAVRIFGPRRKPRSMCLHAAL